METIPERRVFHRQCVRGSAIFNPTLKCLHNGGGLATEAAGTVTETRRLEEAPEVLNIREERPSLVVEIFGIFGGDTGIGLFGKGIMC